MWCSYVDVDGDMTEYGDGAAFVVATDISRVEGYSNFLIISFEKNAIVMMMTIHIERSRYFYLIQC